MPNFLKNAHELIIERAKDIGIYLNIKTPDKESVKHARIVRGTGTLAGRERDMIGQLTDDSEGISMATMITRIACANPKMASWELERQYKGFM
jgi:hypothetical protein